MKKNYEQPTVKKIRFQQIEDIAGEETWGEGSINQDGGAWSQNSNGMNEAFQLHDEP